jgi:hypothetical protein
MKTKIESNIVSFKTDDLAVRTGYGFSQAIATQDELASDFANANKLDTVTKNQDNKKFSTYQDVKDYVTKFMSDSGNYTKVRYGIAQHQVAKHYSEDDTVYLKKSDNGGYAKSTAKSYDEELTPMMAYAFSDTVYSVLKKENAKTNPFGVRGEDMKGFIKPLREDVQGKVRKPYSRFVTKVVNIIANHNAIETPKTSDLEKAVSGVKSLYGHFEKLGDTKAQKILLGLSSEYLKKLS